MNLSRRSFTFCTGFRNSLAICALSPRIVDLSLPFEPLKEQTRDWIGSYWVIVDAVLRRLFCCSETNIVERRLSSDGLPPLSELVVQVH